MAVHDVEYQLDISETPMQDFLRHPPWAILMPAVPDADVACGAAYEILREPADVIAGPGMLICETSWTSSHA